MTLRRAACWNPWWVAFSIALSLMGLQTLGEAFAAEKPPGLPVGANVALGAKYTLWPQPNYVHCTDPGDASQLTDGRSTKNYFWTDKGTVGWTGAPYAVVTVDLGRIEPISGVALTTAAGTAGVVWPASIEIHVSDDGKNFRDVGDLVVLDLKRQGPWPKGYAIRRLVAGDLATRGRFVRFLMIPLAGSHYLFVDEVEVFRGSEELLHRDPGGKPVGDVAEVFQRGRIRRALLHRFRTDRQALDKAIRDSSSGDEATRRRILEQLASLENRLKPEDLPHDASFRAILPMGEAHARLFRLQAEWWRAGGAAPLTALPAVPWDPLDLFQRPEAAGPIDVHAMRGEARSAAVNLVNSTDRPMEVRVKFDGLPGSPHPPYVTVHEVQWTDTSQGTPVAAALPEARRAGSDWVVTVLPGLVRQVWFTFHAVDVASGEHAGRLVFQAEEQSPIVLPMRFRVWPLDMPSQTTLWLGGWDYTDSESRYGVTLANREAFLRHLQERHVNAPWASGGTMLKFQSIPGESGFRLDTRQFDQWLQRWPRAQRYLVFLAVGANFAGTHIGSPEFDRRVGAWITAWVQHLAALGIAADRLGLLIHDEPHEGTDVRPIVAWAKAIRAAQPQVLIWLDPTYRDPRKAPPELFEACNILCPNRPMWLAGGKPFEQFYLEQKQRGRTLQFYSCSGPAKLLDPYSYYRLQAWHAWHVGGTGSFFWAFGDHGKASSWNEYLAVAGPYTPLFLDEQSVTAGKHMEAIRESAQDYEYLVLLREAVRRAKSSGRGGAEVAAAQRLLDDGVAEILASPGADQIQWHAAKDRTKADALRVKLLEALTALR